MCVHALLPFVNAGVNVIQMVVAQVMVQLVVLIIQTILMCAVLIYGFQVCSVY